ncbi:MAG: IS66 family transposase [Planctomycetota bacterium]
MHEEAKRHVEQAEVAHANETGWLIAGQRAWIWLLTNTLLSVFMIQDRRNAEAADTLLGEFDGVLVTDRCPSYGVYDGKRQWCWAHLIRDFAGMALYPGRAGDLGEELHDNALRLFHHYHRWDDEITKRATFLQHANSIRRRMTVLLEQGLRLRNARFQGKCKALYGGWGMAWTFLDNPHIPLTNNLAEQSIRPAVIARKISYGSQSHGGREFTERIMTVVASCRKQGRNVLDFMRQVFGVADEEDGAPTLLPNP